jgi:hypothetical protein
MGIATRLRKTTPRQRQLIVLLIAGAWVSIAVLQISPIPRWSTDEYSPYAFREPYTVEEQTLRATVYAFPAVLFGSILFWWYGGSRKKSEQREPEPTQEIPPVAPAPIRESILAVPQAVAESLPVVVDVTTNKGKVERVDRPYRWGKFQGGALVFGAPFFTLVFFMTAETPEEHARAIGSLILCALTIPMGLGILRKRRYGLILVYV